MISINTINIIGDKLNKLNTPYKFGYAGSYAKGNANEHSDLDIVVSGAKDISLEEYMIVYNLLSSEMNIEFDIINLDSLMMEDIQMDSDLISLGLSKNEHSAYKNISREVVWFE